MRRPILLGLAGAVIGAFAGWVAFAAVTWHLGPTILFNADHTCVTVTGNASGLGNTPAIAHVTVNGTVTYTCQNKGGNQSPGQNPVPASSTGDQDLGNSSHNGRGVLNLTVCITASPTVSGEVAGCPNGNWVGVNPQPFPVPIQGGTLTITQGNKTIYGPVNL
jgi:hypothetical protein